MDTEAANHPQRTKPSFLEMVRLVMPCIALLMGSGGWLYLIGLPGWLAIFPLALFIGAWLWKKRIRWMLGTATVVFTSMIIALVLQRPSNDREWWPETSRLPHIELDGDQAIIHDLRNFKWRDREDFDANWDTRTYDLSTLDSIELMIEPFGKSELVAHVMMGFGFSDGERLIVSIEARKEAHESYGLLPGIFRQFELIYIFGDEQDLLTIRGLAENSRIYAYPIKADQEFMKALLLDFAAAANGLHSEPRFYTSLRQNCTTTLVSHIDHLRPNEEKLGFRLETIFPAKTGQLLFDLGRMDTDLTFDEARKHFRIDHKIRKFVGDDEFSMKLRETRGPIR